MDEQTPDRFTIFVNTSDGFADCWPPFFQLLGKHWTGPQPPVVLNTEKLSWDIAGFDLTCTQVASGAARRLAWSECLSRGLEAVTTPIVLYLQEDYFIDQNIDVAVVNDFVELMINDPTIRHVGLTHFGSEGPFELTQDRRLWRIPQHGNYRLSLQAGLWRTETLRSYVAAAESAWGFELNGSRRAWGRPELFLTASRDIYGPPSRRLVSYAHTGVIKGRWNPVIVPLFSQHHINVDFSRRGFYTPPSGMWRRLETLRSCWREPSILLTVFAMRFPRGR